jgi:phage tail-like protein
MNRGDATNGPAARGSVEFLPSAHPLGELLPGVYLEDPMADAFTAGLDPMLAPVHLTLDCLDAYLDPRLAPLDFLPWLASWVGVELDETLPEAWQRAMVESAGRLHHVHGTRGGLERLVELITGGSVEVRESGGARWSALTGADPPGSPSPGLEVIVRVANPSPGVQERVERVVREVRPAHLPFRVRMVRAG